MDPTPAPAPEPVDPGAAPARLAAVQRYLLYTLSLPERTLRTGVGLAGGALREAGELLTPQAFREATTYRIMVQQSLDFLTNVGGVERPQPTSVAPTASTASGGAPVAPTSPAGSTPAEASVAALASDAKPVDATPSGAKPADPNADDYVARKAVGSFLDLAGLASLHMSPLLALAVISDVAYGSKAYLRELTVELQAQGVIGPDATIQKADDLLAAVSRAASTAAGVFDAPPVSVDGLRETINQLTQDVTSVDVRKVLPQAEIAQLWGEVKEIAARENVGLFQAGSGLTLLTLNKLGVAAKGALSGAKVAGSMLQRDVLAHYVATIHEVRQEGLYLSLGRRGAPYLEAVHRNFSTDRPTVTEDVLTGRLLGKAWGAVRGWWGGAEPAGPAK